jgi:hypothetical protein
MWWLSISRISASDASLSWDAAGCTYDVFESTTPHFTPGATPTYTGVTSEYEVCGRLGNPATNYFFINRATCGGDTIAYSNEVGEFDFAIVARN